MKLLIGIVLGIIISIPEIRKIVERVKGEWQWKFVILWWRIMN